MSGHWEHIGVLDTPCRCGEGRLTVWEESENYPPFRSRCEGWINCKICSRDYRLSVFDKRDIRLYRRADDAVVSVHIRDQRQRVAMLWASEPVQKFRAEMVEWLDQDRTKIGKYRRLEKAGILFNWPGHQQPLSSFRRDFTTTAALAQRVIEYHGRALAQQFPELSPVLQQIDAIHAEPGPPLPFEQLAQREAA